MNTYRKYAQNVFVARCDEMHEKGEIINITTKYGKVIENIVHNYLGTVESDGETFYLYSVTRADGFNSQERARRKAEKLSGYAGSAERRSKDFYKKSDLSESATGIPFGQPILVGHHSESRHRKTIERANRAFEKSMEEEAKADDYKRRADYWEKRSEKIDLSMPESLEYFKFKIEEAEKIHQFLKDNPDKRPHSYSLTYAKKDVNTAKKNYELAVKLWGTLEDFEELEQEKVKKAKKKVSKKKNVDELINKYGGFFFFGSNKDLFTQKYNKVLEKGIIEQGDKYQHVMAGLYLPVKFAPEFLKELNSK